MRLFIALPLPDAIREALLDPMEGIAGARWQDADNLHITLRFIGEATGREAGDLVDALADVACCGFPVAVRGVGQFDKRGRTHSLWAGVETTRALCDLANAVEQASQRAGFAPETRKFVPHVTLARVNRSTRDPGNWFAQHSALALGPWQAEAFALFESVLLPGGSVYDELVRFPLG